MEERRNNTARSHRCDRATVAQGRQSNECDASHKPSCKEILQLCPFLGKQKAGKRSTEHGPWGCGASQRGRRMKTVEQRALSGSSIESRCCVTPRGVVANKQQFVSGISAHGILERKLNQTPTIDRSPTVHSDSSERSDAASCWRTRQPQGEAA